MQAFGLRRFLSLSLLFVCLPDTENEMGSQCVTMGQLLILLLVTSHQFCGFPAVQDFRLTLETYISECQFSFTPYPNQAVISIILQL